VTVMQNNTKKLLGYLEIEVPNHFRPLVVEYYGGKFYSIFPYFSRPQTYSVVIKGQPQTTVFYPHPFMSPVDFYDRREEFATHKYDGIMIWTGDRELRAKWNPTVDVKVDDQVWEVSLSKGLVLERPRYGKGAYTTQRAESRIRSQIRAKFLLPHFLLMPEKRNELVKAVESAADQQVEMNQHAGSKCLFFTRDSEMLMIREPNKRLDFIGGVIEPRETPIDAMVREVLEETHCRMKHEDFLYVGQSKEITDTTEWVSHVYLAMAPAQMKGSKYVEVYKIGDLNQWLKSSEGRPRQVWVSRIMDHIRKTFPTFYELWSAASMVWEYQPLMRSVPSPAALALVRPYYVTKLRKMLLVFNKEGTSMSFLDWLGLKGFWIDDKLLLEVTNRQLGHLLPYPKGEERKKVLEFLYTLYDGSKALTRKAFDVNLRLRAEPATAKDRDLVVGKFLHLGYIIVQDDKLVLNC